MKEYYRLEADEGADVVIPLKRTHPDVRIMITYRTFIKNEMSKNTQSELIADILVFNFIIKKNP